MITPEAKSFGDFYQFTQEKPRIYSAGLVNMFTPKDPCFSGTEAAYNEVLPTQYEV